jgi:hypothetical protein
VATATGEQADDGTFQRLRDRLTNIALINYKLPRFVCNCGSLGEFWTIIQEQSRIYTKRWHYFAEQFDVLTSLGRQAATLSDELISHVLDKMDASHMATISAEEDSN